jgi:hypothetical protein
MGEGNHVSRGVAREERLVRLPRAAECKGRQNICCKWGGKKYFLRSADLKLSKQIKGNATNNFDVFKVREFYQERSLFLLAPGIEERSYVTDCYKTSSFVDRFGWKFLIFICYSYCQ